MHTNRWDVWVYHENADLVITSMALGTTERPFLKQSPESWKKSLHRGEFLAATILHDQPVVVRVVLNSALTLEEDAAWVDRWEAILKLPSDGLLISGDAQMMFGDGYPEFEQRLPQVPAGDYLAQLFTLLPGANGVRTIAKASTERLGAYFRRTRPDVPFPAWLASACAEAPKLDPGHEKEWKGKAVAADPNEYVSFLLHLSPLKSPPLRLRLKDGSAPPVPLNPRLPEVCPLGVLATDVVGRPAKPIRGPIRLVNRVKVGELIADKAPVAVNGGPVSVPASEYELLYRIASLCYRGTYPELKLDVPPGVTFAPEWPNAAVGIRAEPTSTGWRVAFNAMNWEHAHAVPRVAPLLATAPDGVVLELMTAEPETRKQKGQPGWHRYRGLIKGGQWEITQTYPPTSRQNLLDALALCREMRSGSTFRLASEKESEAVRHIARKDSTLRDSLKEKTLSFDGSTARVLDGDSFLRELLAMKIFRVRLGKVWPVDEDDSTDEAWNNMMDQLEAFKQFRSPPADENAVFFAGRRGKFFRTEGRAEQAESAAEWDARLAEIGFISLGRLTYDRAREITLLGYVLPNSPIYALVGLGGLAPQSALDYYTVFDDGASQTTTTNLFADGDAPIWGIFKKALPMLPPAELLQKHRERMPKLAKKHGEPRLAEPTLLALAAAVDEYFVRYDA